MNGTNNCKKNRDNNGKKNKWKEIIPLMVLSTFFALLSKLSSIFASVPNVIIAVWPLSSEWTKLDVTRRIKLVIAGKDVVGTTERSMTIGKLFKNDLKQWNEKKKEKCLKEKKKKKETDKKSIKRLSIIR